MNDRTFLALNKKSGIFALWPQWYQCHRIRWRVVENLYRSVLFFAGFWSWPFTQDLPSKDVGCTERECLGGVIWWRNGGSQRRYWMNAVCVPRNFRAPRSQWTILRETLTLDPFRVRRPLLLLTHAVLRHSQSSLGKSRQQGIARNASGFGGKKDLRPQRVCGSCHVLQYHCGSKLIWSGIGWLGMALTLAV